MIAVPLADVLAPFERIRRVELLAAVGALLLALLLGAVLSQQLTAPIRTLLGATDRVGAATTISPSKCRIRTSSGDSRRPSTR